MKSVTKTILGISIFILLIHNFLIAGEISSERKTLEGVMIYGGTESPGQIELTANRRAASLGNYIRFGGVDGVSERIFEVRMRYKLWTLLGSSVWAFESRSSRLPAMTIYRNDQRVMTIATRLIGDATEVSVEDRDDHMRVTVPNEWMDRVLLYAFNFSAEVNLPDHDNILIYKANPGVAAPAGEWGWDVPGNPPWERMFVDRNRLPDTRFRGDRLHPRDVPEDAWLDAEAAQELYQALLESDRDEPFNPGAVWDLQINLTPLLAAIRREAPEAFDYYYQTSENRQAHALIGSVVNHAESLRDENGIIRSDESLERRRALTERAVEMLMLGSALDPELHELWREVQREVDFSAMRAELQRVQEAVTPHLQGVEETRGDLRSLIPEGTLAQAEAFGKRVASLSADADPLLAEGWERIERLLGIEGVETGGTLVSWGRGQLGRPPSGGDFVDVAVGYQHSVALRSDGTLVSWGRDNDHGLVSETPSGGGFTAVAAGRNHSVALRSDGTLVSWGTPAEEVRDTPSAGGFVAVSAGHFSNVALRSDGTLISWGMNMRWGLLTNTPSGGNFVAVAAGVVHKVALRSDGTLVSWGRDNDHGLVSETPSGGGFTAVAAGRDHSVALRSDGTLVSWGRDLGGVVSDTPSGGDFTSVAAGEGYSLALCSNGTIVSWGRGQLLNDPPSGGGFAYISAGYSNASAIRE